MSEHPKGKLKPFTVRNAHSNRNLKISDIYQPSISTSQKLIESTITSPNSFVELKKILHPSTTSGRRFTPRSLLTDLSPSHSIAKDSDNSYLSRTRLNLKDIRFQNNSTRNISSSSVRHKKILFGATPAMSITQVGDHIEKYENVMSPKQVSTVTRTILRTGPDQALEILKHSQKLKDMSNNSHDGPTTAKCKLAIKLLTLLSEEEGKYSEDMQLIVKELRNGIFCLSQELLDHIQEITNNVVSIKDRSVISYFDLITNLIKYIEQMNVNIKETEEETIRNIEKIKSDYHEREMIFLRKLQEKDSHFKNMKNILETEIAELKEYNTKLFHDKNTLLAEYQDIKDNIDTKNNGNEKSAIIEFVDRIKSLTVKNLELEERYSRQSDTLDEMKYSFKALIENYKAIAYKMKFSKEMTDKMEMQIKELTQKTVDRSYHSNHESTTFTPRPNLNPLVEFFAIKRLASDSSQEVVKKINEIISKKRDTSDQDEDEIYDRID